MMTRVSALILLFAMTLPAAAQEQRSVLVTGASSGIGLRMTEVLSQNGFHVYAGARNQDDINRLGAMDNVSSLRLDVTVQEEIDAAARMIAESGTGLYGLINNAGVAVVGPLIEMPEEDLAFQLDVNLFGPFRITKAFADLLIESEGRIMNTSSISGILSGGFLGAYSMSKHGVEAYTDALGAEMAEFGVQVAAVEPGNYKSRIIATMVERMEAAGYTPETSRYGRSMYTILGNTDRTQFEEPDDVAAAALEFMTAETPQRRYMVVPTQREAEITIRQAIRELVQLNGDHQFSYSQDELARMLGEMMGNN